MTEYNAFNTLVKALDTDDSATPPVRVPEGDLYTALQTAKDAISNDDEDGVQDLIDALEKALGEQTDAQTDVDTLAELNDAIDAAEKAFEDNGFEVPVILGAGSTVATADADIFLVGTALESTIINFGFQGDDALYIGTDFTLNEGALTDGDASLLEVFFIQDGNNAKVVLETKAYGSNEAQVDEIEITLTGVDAGQLSLDADGFVTLG